jgi:Ca2+-binding RTX toxin-like protein
VVITGDGGAQTFQDVSVTLNGTNDAPTTVGADHVITNADAGGGFFLPTWALTLNDSDPDLTDTLSVNSVTSETGVSTFLFGGVIVFDDGTLGGSFDYNTTDGMAVSPGSGTVTVDNQAASVTTLNGTSGNDIIIGTTDGVALSGGGGNDILIGNSGSHVLTGGSGDDIFAFEVVPDQIPMGAANTITDFDNVTDHDHLAISAAAFGGGLTPGMDASTVFESSGDAVFFGSLFHYDEANQTLYFSSDGSTASAIVVTQLQPGVLLQGHDLLIV